MSAHRRGNSNDLFSQPADRRVGRLEERIKSNDPGAQTRHALAADPAGTASLYKNARGANTVILTGVIIASLPTLDRYSVQTEEMGLIECARCRDSVIPIGAHEIGTLAPGNPVLVVYDTRMPYGLIIDVLPPPVTDSRLSVCDWVSQGGGTGIKRENGLISYATAFGNEVRDFGIRRPLDETTLDRGMLTETGVGWTVTPFEAVFRASESAALTVSMFDNAVRLTGWNMTVFSGAHLFEATDDEGEPTTYYGESSFAWESRGLQGPGAFGQEYSDQDVQYDKPVGSHDLPEDGHDIEPVHRYVRYGGYLGQGGLRFVAKPAGSSGPRRRRDANTHDTGLWMESVGRDGAYMNVSAHSSHIGKRLLIAVPRRAAAQADPAGDDAEAKNYKAAGTLGEGEDHQIKDLQYTGEDAHLVRAMTALDFVIYGGNWKALHPFYYHKKDFKLPEERQLGSARSPINLGAEGFAAAPTAKSVEVDRVRGAVDYYATMAGMTILPDGGISINDGYGGRIIMTGGKLILDAPLGIHLRTGGELLCLSEQAVIRAKRSVDISATDKDIRLGAGANMQIASGLGGRGTLLIEGKGKGRSQFYDKRVGEDVNGGGVVIKATNGVAGLIGDDVYVRSRARDITLDAGAGEGSVYLAGNDVTMFSTSDINMFLGATPDAPEVEATYRFGASQAIMAADTMISGRIYSLGEGGLIARGDIIATGSIACGGSMADRKGWFLGKVPDGFRRELNAAIDKTESSLADFTEFAGKLYDAVLVSRYYSSHQPGEKDTLDAMVFSFRDDAKQTQYGAKKFVMLEPSWSELIRQGAATGMSAKWTELSVTVQGVETMPFPGKAVWKTGKSMLVVSAPQSYDAKTGVSKDRPLKSNGPTATKKSPDGEIPMRR